jgi:hypothetical protein
MTRLKRDGRGRVLRNVCLGVERGPLSGGVHNGHRQVSGGNGESGGLARLLVW